MLTEGRPFFRDRLGRKWELDRYAEMVARTTIREAMTRGTISQFLRKGIELGQASAHNEAGFR